MSMEQIKHYLPQLAYDCPLTGWQYLEEKMQSTQAPSNADFISSDMSAPHLEGKVSGRSKLGLRALQHSHGEVPDQNGSRMDHFCKHVGSLLKHILHSFGFALKLLLFMFSSPERLETTCQGPRSQHSVGTLR